MSQECRLPPTESHCASQLLGATSQVHGNCGAKQSSPQQHLSCMLARAAQFWLQECYSWGLDGHPMAVQLLATGGQSLLF